MQTDGIHLNLHGTKVTYDIHETWNSTMVDVDELKIETIEHNAPRELILSAPSQVDNNTLRL